MHSNDTAPGWLINDDQYSAISIVRILFFLIPTFAPIFPSLMFLLAPCCCMCCCHNFPCGQAMHGTIMGVTKYLFSFLKREDGSNGNKKITFRVVGFVAPTCYTYFLIYVTFVVFIHCSTSFLFEAIQLDNKRVYNHSSVHDCTATYSALYGYNYPCVYYTNGHILTIKLSSGIEQATFVFGAFIVFFSLSSYFLLKCSGGKKTGSMSCVAEHVTCCRRTITILVQTVFIFLPRIVCFWYFFHRDSYSPDSTSLIAPSDIKDSNSNSEDSYVHRFTDLSGLMDAESYFLLVAVADSISISMFTPWYLFIQDNGKIHSNNNELASRC